MDSFQNKPIMASLLLFALTFALTLTFITAVRRARADDVVVPIATDVFCCIDCTGKSKGYLADGNTGHAQLGMDEKLHCSTGFPCQAPCP